jgi:signal transduction histidine kinase
VVNKLRCNSEEIALENSDDGVGFDPKQAFIGHLGPRSMRGLTSCLHETLALGTAEDIKTRIRARIHL